MITINQAGINDIPIIQTLAYKIWPKTFKEILSQEQMDYMLNMMYSHGSLQKQIEDNHHFIIATQDDAPISFAAYYQKEDITSLIFKLDKIYVLPNLQGTGVGKVMIDHIISIMRKTDAGVLELNVNRQNKAVSFYQKFGFKIIKEEDISIGNGYFMNDFVMQKVI